MRAFTLLGVAQIRVGKLVVARDARGRVRLGSGKYVSRLFAIELMRIFGIVSFGNGVFVSGS